MQKRVLVTMVTLGMAQAAYAGNYSNEVLAIGVGARALGMGGAYVAKADDSTSVYWNPAGLSKVQHVEISAIQQGRQYSGLNLNEVGSRYIFTSGAMNFPKIGTFGAAFMRFGVDDIPQVSGLDLAGVPIQTGTFQTQDFAFFASYGKEFHPAFRAGLTAKHLTGGTVGLKAGLGVLGDASYTSTGLDLGIQVDFGGMSPSLKGLNFGLNLQDLYNTGAAWKNTPTSPTDKVDINAKVGLSYSPQLQFLTASKSEFTLAYDADPKYGDKMLHHLGGEFWYKETIALRGGARMFSGGLQNLETTLGASFRMFILQVDYAFINYELTPIHYLSLAVKF